MTNNDGVGDDISDDDDDDGSLVQYLIRMIHCYQ